jgi:Integrase core domain
VWFPSGLFIRAEAWQVVGATHHQLPREHPDEQPQECPHDGVWSSRDGASRARGGVERGGGRARVRGQHAHRAQVARPLSKRGPCRPAEPQLGAAPGRQQAACALACDGHPPAPRLPDDRRGDRRAASPGAQHGGRPPRPPRARPAGAPGAARAGTAVQSYPRRRARPPRYQEARPLPPRRAPHHRRSTPRFGRRRLGVRPRRRRRCLQARLRRGPAGRAAPVGDRFPGPRSALVPKPRHPRRAGHDRQRLRLPLAAVPQGLPDARPAPPAHPALHAQDQRQGRALHPDLLREWAYALPYRSSDTRAADLPRWLRHYNHERPHASLIRQTPITWLQAQT